MWLLALALALPFLPLFLLIRKRRLTMFQRLGVQGLPERGEGVEWRPVWIHALSVGELISALKLIEKVRQRAGGRPVYVSVSTLEARELAASKLAGKVDGIFYFPYDVFFAVERVIRRVRPHTFVIVETDLWPYFLWRMECSGAAMYLVNTRLSPRTYKGYNRLRAIIEPCLARFRAIVPQSEDEILRFKDLGIRTRHMPFCGNLKYDAIGIEEARAQLEPIARQIPFAAGTPILIGASTHPGEEAVFFAAACKLRATFPDLRFICVPRHPGRGAAIARLAESLGLRTALISARPGESRSCTDAELLIVDTIGHLAGLQTLATVAFIGGSLIAEGGQNPIEAASFGIPIILGPDMTDFPEIAPALLDCGAAVTARNAEEIAAAAAELLRDPELARRRGAAGKAYIESHRDCLDRVVALVLGA